MSDLTQGFEPILGARATVLILGTLPSQQSLKLRQYYGHPRNAFWPIMGELFSAGPELVYRERTRLLTGQAVAVWDVLAGGHRPGSMDSAIDQQSAKINDFGTFHDRHPELQAIFFNGQAAARLFQRLVPIDVLDSLAAVQFVTMPSTSPAYAAMSFEEKLNRWSSIKYPHQEQD